MGGLSFLLPCTYARACCRASIYCCIAVAKHSTVTTAQSAHTKPRSKYVQIRVRQRKQADKRASTVQYRSAASTSQQSQCYEPKTVKTKFGRSSQTETELFLVGSSVAQKNETEKPTRFFSVGFVLQPTPAKHRPKPTQNSVTKRKTDQGRFTFGSQPPQQQKPDRNRPTFSVKNRKPTDPFFIFGLFAVHNPGRHMIPTLNLLKYCLFSWVHQETDRESDRQMFGFGFGFGSFRGGGLTTETDGHFGEKPKNRPRPFSFSVHNPEQRISPHNAAKHVRADQSATTQASRVGESQHIHAVEQLHSTQSS